MNRGFSSSGKIKPSSGEVLRPVPHLVRKFLAGTYILLPQRDGNRWKMVKEAVMAPYYEGQKKDKAIEVHLVLH